MTRSGRAGDAELAIDPGPLTRILTGFLQDEVTRAGRRRLVLGVSGGLDSAVAAALAVRALGRQAVHALVMPSRTSNPRSAIDAETVIGWLGILGERIDITPMVDGFLGATPSADDMRLGNAMARARMIFLYDRSAALDALVMGTSNKTELLLGYGTLHGDMASAVNPLGDLYKTQVRMLAVHLQVPAAIRRKPPSADLWTDQSDEQELGFRYEDVDRLLALAIDARVGRRWLVEEGGFAPEFVDGVMRRVVASQFKRVPPLIAKVSTRTIGWDFRYPRDWRS